MKSITPRQQHIVDIITSSKDPVGFKQIMESFISNQLHQASEATLKRELSSLAKMNLLSKSGKGRSVKYCISKLYRMISPINEADYFKTEVDQRDGQRNFNFELFNLLGNSSYFSPQDIALLNSYQVQYQKKIKDMGQLLINKEFERLIIELSWKSSAIEGNTYDLLETENLLREGIKVEEKSDEEALMLLNHKKTFIFIRENLELFRELNITIIDKLHSLLVADLHIETKLRSKMVAITGTTYRPLDNQFKIREALEQACTLINIEPEPHIKAFLTLILIAYIQPFEDGNKRTSRLLANAILLAHGCFALSFRSLNILEYKKAMLLFYEQNYLLSIKKLYLDQAKFSCENYF